MFHHSYKLNPCKCGSAKQPDLDSDDMVPCWGVRCGDCSQFQHGEDWKIEQAVEKWNEENPIKIDPVIEKHEHLKFEDFYESKRISSGRTKKRCEHCSGDIRKGSPHFVHQFNNGEWFSCPTHINCEKPFIESLN